MVKTVILSAFLSLGFFALSQNGYVEQTIAGGDTSSVYQPGQIYWKLLQGTTDFIQESKKDGTGVKDFKYPIKSISGDGFIKEYVVQIGNDPSFTIRFHTRDRIVTYIYDTKTIVYRGKNIRFDFEEIPSR